MLREDVQNKLGSLIQPRGGLGLPEEADATTVVGRGIVIPEFHHHWSER